MTNLSFRFSFHILWFQRSGININYNFRRHALFIIFITRVIKANTGLPMHPVRYIILTWVYPGWNWGNASTSPRVPHLVNIELILNPEHPGTSALNRNAATRCWWEHLVPARLRAWHRLCPLSPEYPYRLVTINFLSWSKEPDLREIVQFPPVYTLFCKLGVESTGSVDLSCADIGSLCSATPLLRPWSEGFLDLSRH